MIRSSFFLICFFGAFIPRYPTLIQFDQFSWVFFHHCLIAYLLLFSIAVLNQENSFTFNYSEIVSWLDIFRFRIGEGGIVDVGLLELLDLLGCIIKILGGLPCGLVSGIATPMNQILNPLRLILIFDDPFGKNVMNFKFRISKTLLFIRWHWLIITEITMFRNNGIFELKIGIYSYMSSYRWFSNIFLYCFGSYFMGCTPNKAHTSNPFKNIPSEHHHHPH